MIKIVRYVTIPLIFLAVFAAACGGTGDSEPYTGERPFVIVDRVGQTWDVTHAYDVYGMNPDYFNYGLGFGAISSVDDPTVLAEGDPGYPESTEQTAVFGVERNGEARAYGVRTLTRHEVFNDVYPGEPDQHVAVAY